MTSTPPTTSTTNTDTSRRTAIRALLILIAITIVLAGFTGVYLFTRPSYAGEWVGPGNVQQGDGDPDAIVASLSLAQNPLGGISGTGTVCAVSSGSLTQIPVSVEGNLTGSLATLTLHASGSDTTIFPTTLTADGALDQGQLTLNAESPAHLLLTLQHGDASDFTTECNQLTQPASG